MASVNEYHLTYWLSTVSTQTLTQVPIIVQNLKEWLCTISEYLKLKMN